MLPELSTNRPTNSISAAVIESRSQRVVQSDAKVGSPLSNVTGSIIVRSIPSGLFTVSNSKPVGLKSDPTKYNVNHNHKMNLKGGKVYIQG